MSPTARGGLRTGSPGRAAPTGGPVSAYERLWSTDPAAWATTGAAWAGLTGQVDARVGELVEAAATLRGGWSGAAAGAARTRLDGLGAELAVIRPALIEVDQTLAVLAARLAAAKARLAEAVALAGRAGVAVDRTGRVGADPAVPRPPERLGPTVAQVSGAIGGALAAAAAADREATGRLSELAVSAGAGWVAAPPLWRPPAGAGPALVARWWGGLTPAERRWLVLHEARLVGRLDGVPVAARDQANRLLLGAHRAVLLDRCRRSRAGALRGTVAAVGQRRAAAALAGLDALADRLAAGPPRAYLLGLDPTGDGRAVVALGDPDHADNVLTYVPGMTSDLAGAAGELGRAARVLSRCAALAPGAGTAAVLWLDYDAPDFLPEATRSGQAGDAGPALSRFQDGLRASHDGPPARQTVLGHSYGSLVVGVAAREHGLGADALVFVGSPGVGVSEARELRVPPGQVWASTAPDDVIRLARPLDDLARGAVLDRTPVGPVARLLGGDRHELWFGRDPSDPGFGARRFPSGRYGHTGYWEADNPALDGMARIVLGR
ncbi:Alpha/beta hydrolase [Micromonospora mirobrigensis]|uniref:Alpha/beta hydrolase n=1 Tax=Micromonospora mirobrigensis TaxID=262898 RepID=A0A1C4Y4Q1_9ACTN|nr:Alpha/beta hydrolase [Micromonospora mirobrigensis]